MEIRRRTNEKRMRNRTKAILLLVFILAIFFQKQIWILLSGASSSSSQSYLTARNSLQTSVASLSLLFTSKESLLTENNYLKNEIEILKTRATTTILLQAELEKLKGVIGKGKGTSTDVYAQILSRPPESAYDTVVLNVGKNTHIENGDILYAPDSEKTIALGTISNDIYEDTAKATFYSSPNIKTSVFFKHVSDETFIKATSTDMDTASTTATSTPPKKKITRKVPAVEVKLTTDIIGMGGGNLSAQIPKDITLTSGDLVVLKESPTTIVGIVEKIYFDPRNPYQSVFIRTPVNPFTLEGVIVKTTTSHAL